MTTVISIVIAIVIFCIIITIHEFGHYLSARLFKITVREFAIGMGPAIYKHQGKNTLFAIRALPIGGYCDMSEDREEDAEEDANHFRNKSVWKRMITIVAGASMNLILGFIFCLIFVSISGNVGTNVISSVADTPAAENSGLEVGDEILSINGRHMYSSKDISYILSTDEDGIVKMVVKRGTDKITLPAVVFPIYINKETGRRTLEYGFKVVGERVTIKNIARLSGGQFVYMSRVVILSLADLIRGKYGLNDLSGPVGIVSVISGATKEIGVSAKFLLQIAALITINVGLFNLLPLPALDGGRFIFLLIEAVSRKPVKPEVEGVFHFVGFALLMVLMVVITVKDVRDIFV
ncbi:MAG: site-2 protease family protein [Ruminococcus sp.]|nr:site-2 protease family protein [Ruminococcus sp.]